MPRVEGQAFGRVVKLKKEPRLPKLELNKNNTLNVLFMDMASSDSTRYYIVNVLQFFIPFFFAPKIRYFAIRFDFILDQPLFPRMKLHAVQVPSAQPQSVRDRKGFCQVIQNRIGSIVEHGIAGETSLKYRDPKKGQV